MKTGDLFTSIKDAGKLDDLLAQNEKVLEMPKEIAHFQSESQQRLHGIMQTGALGVTSFFQISNSILVSSLPAMVFFLLFQREKKREYSEFVRRFGDDLDTFQSESIEYMVPQVRKMVDYIIYISQKGDYSDIEVSHAISDLKSFLDEDEGQIHFQNACQRHPYIVEWLEYSEGK